MSIDALEAALGDTERVLFDSSALIAFHSRLEPAHPLAKHLLTRVEDDRDRLRGYYSVLSATELLIRPIRTGVAPFTFMHTFLTTYPNLTPLPVDLMVATQAATLRATAGIRVPDAIVVASALLSGCEAIVTNDETWKRKLAGLFRDFRWICLGDFT